jgi:hypothetical protein
MKIPFRIALISALLLVLIPTVAMLGFSAYLSGRFTVQDLSEQILEQTTARIEERTRAMLQTAAVPCNLVVQHLSAQERQRHPPVSARDFPQLTTYLAEVMNAYPDLSFLGVGLEEKGDYCTGIRRPGRLEVQECVRNKAGQIERRDYLVQSGVRRLYNSQVRAWQKYRRCEGSPCSQWFLLLPG